MPATPDLSPAPPPRVTRPLVAVAWMVVTGLQFVGVIAFVKLLGDRIPASQSAFLRYALGLVFLIPLWSALKDVRPTPAAWRRYGLRSLLHAAGVVCWFYAMARITIAEVTAMNYLTPVYITLGAALFLGERLRARRIAAVVVALAGALVILRPGVRDLGTGHLAMAAVAFLFAGSYLMAKRMTDDAPPAFVVAMLSVGVTALLAPVALAVWVPPGWEELAILFVVAAFATGGHLTMTLAFREAPMAVTQPVTFLQLVWSVLVGALVFAEPVDVWVVAGGALILASVSFIAWREARLAAGHAR